MSRFVALAAAIALVLSGMMIGAFGTYLLMHREASAAPPPAPPMPMGPGPFGPPGPGGPLGPAGLPFTREMNMRLDLTREQRDKIADILLDGRKEAETLRRELRPKLEAHLDSVRKRISDVLTPEQRKTFEALVKEDKRRADRMILEPPGGPTGPPGPPPF